MDQREVRAAWEKFVERGALSSDLRSSVAASWQRSKNHRVTVDRARAPLVADAELFRHRSKHASLRHAARCALENSKTFLSDANSIMILTDPTGLIIDTQGDDRVIDAGRTVHLEHGGRWSEADIGTNAIGAAIAESKPVQIRGAEHFCSEGAAMDLCCRSGSRSHRWRTAWRGGHLGPGQHLQSAEPRSGRLRRPSRGKRVGAIGPARSRKAAVPLSRQESRCGLSDECIVLDRRGTILHATERALSALQNNRHGIGDDAPTRFLKTLPFDEWPVKLKELLPNASFDLVEQRNLRHRRYRGAACAATLADRRSRRSEAETRI